MNRTLIVYRRERSAVWQCRYRINRLWQRASTGEHELPKAIEKAHKMYIAAEVRHSNGLPVVTRRVKHVAALALKRMEDEIATDALLKNEFDTIRGTDASHPVWDANQLHVRAFAHPDLETWRSNFKGLRVTHTPTGATIFGAVDDLRQHLDTGELHIVDYKSTSKQGTPDLEGGFGAGYKRQIEIYQWLYRQAGFAVSPIGYFLYVNGSKEGGFYLESEGRMRFVTTLLAHEGNTDWVEDCIIEAVACFQGEQLPASATDCDTCRYVAERSSVTNL